MVRKREVACQWLFTFIKYISLNCFSALCCEKHTNYRTLSLFFCQAIDTLHEVVEKQNQICEIRNTLLDPFKCSKKLREVGSSGLWLHVEDCLHKTWVVAKVFEWDETSLPTDLCCKKSAFCWMMFNIVLGAQLRKGLNGFEQRWDCRCMDWNVVQPDEYVRLEVIMAIPTIKDCGRVTAFVVP